MNESINKTWTEVNQSTQNISVPTYNLKNASSGVLPTVDMSGTLGYGIGRVLRGVFDNVCGAWHKWWYPGRTPETLAQQRQAAIYREGLRAAISQLDLSIQNLRKNPRASNSLDHFKQVVSEYNKYWEPAQTEDLRAYQKRLFTQLRTRVQCLKIASVRETVWRYLPMLQTPLGDHSMPQLTPTHPNPEKRSITDGTVPTAPLTKGSFFNLTTLNGKNGFTINGLNANDNLGICVSNAGDVNGDDKADLILGAYQASPGGRTQAGTAYVLFGQASGWPSQFNLSTLNGNNGFTVEGLNAYDNLGYSASTAGDVNGDGFDDLVLGTNQLSFNGQAGTVYVLFGRASGWSSQFNLSTLNGNNGFAVYVTNYNFINSVSTAGDVNGDGFTDLVLGVESTLYGAAYVLFGHPSSWTSQINLSTLNGTNGFAVYGTAFSSFGNYVSTAGDINSDGFADLILGAYLNSPIPLIDAGTVYVVFGKARGWTSQFDLQTLNGTNGFAVNGPNSYAHFGISASTGDLNGDSRIDLVVGSDNILSGMLCVLFGQASGWPSQVNIASLNSNHSITVDGLNGNDHFGYSVSAGDVNGDGIADAVVGAYGASRVYVIFGQVSGLSSQFSLSSLNGSNGFVIDGVVTNSYIGHPVSVAGDVNGDNTMDIVLGAYGASPSGRNSAGAVNKPLVWLYHDITIARAQRLRLSPFDIAASCGTNNSQPYGATYFSVTGIRSATLQQRNASGAWNFEGLNFWGQDLATGRVTLVHDGSMMAPELNVTATDGLTTLPVQAVQVNFITNDLPPVLVSFRIDVTATDSRITLTSQDIVLESVGKLADLVIVVENVQNGYFVQQDALGIPITEFTYYQVQTGQIQLVHNGSETIHFDIKVSDGLTSSIPQSQIVTLLGNSNEPVTYTGLIVGVAVTGGAILVGGLVAFGWNYYKFLKREESLDRLATIVLDIKSST